MESSSDRRSEILWGVVLVIFGVVLRVAWPGGLLALIGVTLALFGLLMAVRAGWALARHRA